MVPGWFAAVTHIVTTHYNHSCLGIIFKNFWLLPSLIPKCGLATIVTAQGQYGFFIAKNKKPMISDHRFFLCALL